MKKIFYIIIFSALIFCNKINSQTTNEVIKSIQSSSTIKLPYGDENMLHKFPKKWENFMHTKQNKIKQKVDYDSLFNKLGAFIYQDLENKNRTVLKTQYPANNVFLDSQFKISDAVKSHNKEMELRFMKIITKAKFSIYSIIYDGDIDCSNCEYPEHQTQNIVVSIGNGNNVIDKLLISYNNGSDLGQISAFFLIDKNQLIHIKKFESDELVTRFIAYKKYKISSRGKFIKLNQKQ
jgi:hypothetical protein